MTENKKRKPKMKDVAKLAGVSQTTVSFVINNNPDGGIPEETKERVWAAVLDLGYRPNVLAQSLRRQKSGIIGFVTDEIATTPHAGKIFEGAQDVAWEHGKILLLVNTQNNPEIKKAAIEKLLDHWVEGMIYATMYHRQVSPPETLWEIPTVLLDCFVEDRSLPSVVPAERDGAYRAVNILIEKGHRRIGFINNRDSIPASVGRLSGYKEALADNDMPFNESLICEFESIAEGGYQGAQCLMKVEEPPTSIFCFNDRMAMGAYDALRKLGLSIPKDIAVMGFDNQELIAAHLYPALSTMELPHYQMGEWAANKLIEYSDDPERINPVQHTIRCPLIMRESV
jgi:LacI family transcriptional regulator